jgi:hypothetical protein
MNKSKLYLSMYGNVCDRIRISREEGLTVLRWLDEVGPILNPTTSERIRDSMHAFTLGDNAPSSIEYDTGAGHIAALRYCVEAARLAERRKSESKPG